MHRFKDLEIWKLSRIFCKLIYEITETFPEKEKFGIINQMRRASVSIPSNIAEGASRKSNKDFSRFLEIAIGSCYELETQLLIAKNLDYISDIELDMLLNDLYQIQKMIFKLKEKLN